MSSATARAQGGLLSASALMGGAMLLVSAANWVLNVLLSRVLEPALFGDASLAMTVVLVAALAAATLQLAASKAVAAHPEARPGVRRVLVRAAWAGGAVVATTMTLGAAALAEALSVSSPWMFVILGAGLPIYFVQAVHRGVAQGDLRFGRVALSYLVEAAVRLVVAALLAATGAGAIGVAIGIALSFAASAFVARGRVVDERTPRVSVPWATLRAAVAGAVVLLVAQVLINNVDILIAKARFDSEAAGVYAAGATAGRLTFFVSWAIVQVALPIVARAGVDPRARRRAVLHASAIVGAIGAAACGAAALAGPELVVLVFGADYAAAADILVPYTLASALFALANLWASFDIARGRRLGPALLLGGAVLQTGLLLLEGFDAVRLAELQVIAMGVTSVVLVAAVARGARDRRADQGDHPARAGQELHKAL